HNFSRRVERIRRRTKLIRRRYKNFARSGLKYRPLHKVRLSPTKQHRDAENPGLRKAPRQSLAPEFGPTIDGRGNGGVRLCVGGSLFSVKYGVRGNVNESRFHSAGGFYYVARAVDVDEECAGRIRLADIE